MPGFLGGSTSSSGTGGEITFPKEFIDPVTKLRISQPENLIDTDFEYGLQPTKWETVELINNTPSFFSKSGDTTIPNILSISTNNGTREITVVTAIEHGLAVGIPINVTGTKSVTADGSYIINSIPNSTTFTYLCKDNQSGNNAIEDLYTSIITGEFFQGSQIRISDAEGIVTNAAGTSVLTVTTESTHGFGLNTPFYFLNLNSTISQEFEASNTAAKQFDSSNSATAQTFDGSNTLSTFNIDWSNSATVGGSTSTISNVNTTNDTIIVTHGAENFANKPVGTPLYYNLSAPASSGYFLDNPRGVVFLKTINALNTPPGTSTFQVSAIPDGDAIDIVSSMSGTFQLANQARTFSGNNSNPTNQTSITVVKEQEILFDGNNQGYVGQQTNGLCTVQGYSGTILVSVTASAGLDYYDGAMVKYSTTGSAASGLSNNATYFITNFSANVNANFYNFNVKEYPDSAAIIAATGGSGVQTFTKIGVSTDKDIIHIRNSSYAVKDMLEYSFPAGGRFAVANNSEEKLFYFVSKAYDTHNYELSESVSSVIEATGGAISNITHRGRTYKVHTFTSGSTNFVVTSAGSSPSLQYLIVAGGGSGGSNLGGGGGGGGVLTNVNSAPLAVTAQTYVITVGNGGASVSGGQGGAVANDGQNSSAFGLTAIGGGGAGGGSPNRAARSGGSGGGAGGYEGAGGAAGTAGPPRQGNDGGTGESGNQYRAGGGGGAALAGGNLNNSFGRGGYGGTGVVSYINSNTGLYFGGGGGGGSYVSSRGGGIGGAGGGGGGGTNSSVGTFGFGGVAGINAGANGASSGDGNANTVPTGGNGGANTGGGGGGGGHQTAVSGAGGSGIVIVRYPITPVVELVAPVATGGTITNVTQNGLTYKVHAFYSVGSTSFTVSQVGSWGDFEFLVVGGGGGGGSYVGGGGGGGGMAIGTFSPSVQTYTALVGGGGNPEAQGGTSSFTGSNLTISCPGGGAGGRYNSGAGGAGGSGGGGGARDVQAGQSDAGQSVAGTLTGNQLLTSSYFGNRGGITTGGRPNNDCAGSGGGGAGTQAPDRANIVQGNGGNGRPSSILGTTYYFAGGGGGGGYYPGDAGTDGYAGSGGFGGGGGGGRHQTGTAGLGGGFALNSGADGSSGGEGPGGAGGANTGGGGGGTGHSQAGGVGGSGIVVIRYPIAIVS